MNKKNMYYDLILNYENESYGDHKLDIQLKKKYKIILSDHVNFEFWLSEKESLALHWYLNEFLQSPDPLRYSEAFESESLIEELGLFIFECIFMVNGEFKETWKKIKEISPENIRFCIEYEHPPINSLPFEFIKEPEFNTSLALHFQSFYRKFRIENKLKNRNYLQKPIKILFVISRPKRELDNNYMSVSGNLLKSLIDTNYSVELFLLRPPTFENLINTLKKAFETRKPFDIIHFDGHGLLANPSFINKPKVIKQVNGTRGLLLFEYGKWENDNLNIQYVDGYMLGKCMNKYQVPLISLNACQSARSYQLESSISKKIIAHYTLAENILQEGVNCVIAMNQRIYDDTAFYFYKTFYESLLNGNSLKKSMTIGRRELYKERFKIGLKSKIRLQDWVVPVLYERNEVYFNLNNQNESSQICNMSEHTISKELFAAISDFPKLPSKVPKFNPVDFLYLDRYFDSYNKVYLTGATHKYKLCLSVYFSKWYVKTTRGHTKPIVYKIFDGTHNRCNLLKIDNAKRIEKVKTSSNADFSGICIFDLISEQSMKFLNENKTFFDLIEKLELMNFKIIIIGDAFNMPKIPYKIARIIVRGL